MKDGRSGYKGRRLMFKVIIVGYIVVLAIAWFCCCFKTIQHTRRERKAIKKALRDAGYV